MHIMAEGTIEPTHTLAILGLISQRPMTGYDLRRVFTTTPMWHFSSSPGAIYPALQCLDSGLIKGIVEGQDTLRPKESIHYRRRPAGIGTEFGAAYHPR